MREERSGADLLAASPETAAAMLRSTSIASSFPNARTKSGRIYKSCAERRHARACVLKHCSQKLILYLALQSRIRRSDSLEILRECFKVTECLRATESQWEHLPIVGDPDEFLSPLVKELHQHHGGIGRPLHGVHLQGNQNRYHCKDTHIPMLHIHTQCRTRSSYESEIIMEVKFQIGKISTQSFGHLS